ncbi:MAG: 23S rRNA (pseudouridine(1915)-N(3))-methyltransferase RlmH [Rhodospirillales bacterium]
MRFWIIAGGRFRRGPEADLYAFYADRLRPKPELREVEDRKKSDVPARVRREGDMMADLLPKGGYVVALDERGKALSSEDFAAFLTELQDRGVGDISFLIGGADGLDAGLRDRADRLLSFGPATWPHLLVRGLLAEQLYRAQSIQAGHPYHRAG